MKFDTSTIRGFLLSQLTSGKAVTAAKVAKKFGTSSNSVSARINELRSDGFSIYGNSGSDGSKTYRLGKPSRAMVAAAYAAQGSAVFS